MQGTAWLQCYCDVHYVSLMRCLLARQACAAAPMLLLTCAAPPAWPLQNALGDTIYVALVVTIVRLLAIYFGSLFGGQLSGTNTEHKRLFWMSMVTQVGGPLGPLAAGCGAMQQQQCGALLASAQRTAAVTC